MPRLRLRRRRARSTSALLLLGAGAAVGVALGALFADRVRQARRRRPRPDDPILHAAHGTWDDSDDEDERPAPPPRGAARPAPPVRVPSLERRVLEAFRNDPVLAERAIDIGEDTPGVIALTGWVRDAEEIAHARTIAGGVPGVARVDTALAVRPPKRPWTLRGAAPAGPGRPA